MSATLERNATATPTTASSSVAITPFAQPANCSSLYSMVLKTTETDVDYSYTMVSGSNVRHSYTTTTSRAQYLSDVNDPRFSSCQMPGWSKYDWVVSPALCPKSWIYHSMTATPSGASNVTRAACCAPSFSKHGSICESITFHNRGGADTYMYTPYTVQWRTTDVPSMTISVPDLSGGKYIDKWTVGQLPNYYTPYVQSESDNLGWGLKDLALVIALPIVAAIVLVVGITVCCCVVRRRERRKQEAAAIAAAHTNYAEMCAVAATEAASVPHVDDIHRDTGSTEARVKMETTVESKDV